MTTIQVTIGALIVAILLGILFAVLKTAPSRALRTVASVYVEVFRAVPVLTQLFVIYFGLAGIGPFLARGMYGALALVVFAALLVLFARWRRAVTSAPLVWPFVPLYFAWRSLQNYFVLATLFALVADEELAPEVPPPTPH